MNVNKSDVPNPIKSTTAHSVMSEFKYDMATQYKATWSKSDQSYTYDASIPNQSMVTQSTDRSTDSDLHSGCKYWRCFSEVVVY